MPALLRLACGVARIYQMSLNNGAWKLWREARLLAALGRVFSGDDRRSRGPGRAAEGSQWKHEFDLNYVRPG